MIDKWVKKMLHDVHNKLNIIALPNVFKLTYDKDNNTLFLPLNYNMNDFLSIVSSYSFPNLKILSTSLITMEVLEAIRDNQYISSIILGCEDDPFTLTREIFDLLNQSESLFNIMTNKVVGKYSSREIEYLAYFKKVKVGQYCASDLMFLDSFHFYMPLDDLEIEYLNQYLKNGVSITFEYQNYDSVLKVIKTLNGKHINFNIRDDKQLFNYLELFQEVMDQGEKISIIESMQLYQYIFIMSYMKMMVKDIASSTLSTYERYLAVYEIVTHFKEYLEVNQHFALSRELEYVLFNQFIVCEGFSNLFVALLELVGISACNVEIIIQKEREIPTLAQEAQLNREKLELLRGNVAYHSRVLVRLSDLKYHIDGVFISDPTWDNSLENHFFNHSLMTPYETSLEKVTFGEMNIDIFKVNSSEEFLDKVTKNEKILNDFIDIIQKIDLDYYLHLKKDYSLDTEDSGFLLDVYNYIITHCKKKVSDETKNQALDVLFHFIYSELDSSFLKKVIEDNQERQKYYFKNGGR